MEPVVNGLENKYGEYFEFRWLDASRGIGKDAFTSYGLFGHPGNVVIDENGKVIWVAYGEQPSVNLEAELDIIIEGKTSQD